MLNATNEFVGYLFRKAASIPAPVLEKARMCREDYLAVVAAGARKNREKWGPLLSRLPKGNARLFGYDLTTDGKTAALINGFNAHALELDDGQRFAMIHLGAGVISAIDAAAADGTVDETAYLKGIVMGYEAACRVSIAMQPAHKMKGYHAAGTCGTIGAAVGVAFALGFSEAQLKRALTAAAGSAAGLLEIQEQQSELKPYNLGRAAMDGLTAAYMGLAEFEPPDDMLGGERGFFKMFGDGFDADKLTGAAEYYEIQRIYVKPYASCRHSHSAVEAAITLHPAVSPGQVDRVLVETYRLGVKGHDHTEIKGVASAKLSTPYAVAAALLYGRADLTVFEPLDDAVLTLAKKVNVTENESFSAQSDQKRIAAVTVFFKDGTDVTKQVDYAKGDPENPMTKEELTKKKEMLFAYTDRGQ